MEEQKKSNGGLIAVIIIICVFIFVIVPIGGVMFFWLGWPAIQKSVNEQWNEIIEEENNKKPVIEKDEPTISNSTTLDKTINGKVVIYFFRGEGCPHCTEAEAWFESIKEEYGKMFIIKDYETWYNTENESFMKKVAESRDEKVIGVPYIIIGNKSWNGFTESYEDEMLSEIKRVYELY